MYGYTEVIFCFLLGMNPYDKRESHKRKMGRIQQTDFMHMRDANGILNTSS